MEIFVNYGQLNLLLSDLERYAAIVESLSEQIAPQPRSSSLHRTAYENMQSSCAGLCKLKTVLESVILEYSATEDRLSTLPSAGYTIVPVTSNTIEDATSSAIFPMSSVPLYIQLLFGGTAWDILGGVSKASSFMKKSENYSEWLELIFDSDAFGDLKDYFHDIGQNGLFKAAGYLSDGKKLIDALYGGDSSTLENIIEKYAKKGVKSGIKFATDVKISGVTGGVYLDLGWNLGENAVESIQNFKNNPSLNSAFSGFWNITAGTFFDAGAGLAKDVFSFIGDVTGQEFDANDFGNAMDYLWHHPIKSAVATGEVIVDGVASFFDWLF